MEYPIWWKDKSSRVSQVQVRFGVRVLDFGTAGGLAWRWPSGGLDPSASLGMTCVGARDDVLVARIDMKGLGITKVLFRPHEVMKVVDTGWRSLAARVRFKRDVIVVCA